MVTVSMLRRPRLNGAFGSGQHRSLMLPRLGRWLPSSLLESNGAAASVNADVVNGYGGMYSELNALDDVKPMPFASSCAPHKSRVKWRSDRVESSPNHSALITSTSTASIKVGPCRSSEAVIDADTVLPDNSSCARLHTMSVRP